MHRFQHRIHVHHMRIICKNAVNSIGSIEMRNLVRFRIYQRWAIGAYKNTAFGQATLTIPGTNISIPLAANSLGNLTAHNATNQQTNQAQQAHQNQTANQTGTGATTTQTQQQQHTAQQSVIVHIGLFSTFGSHGSAALRKVVDVQWDGNVYRHNGLFL